MRAVLVSARFCKNHNAKLDLTALGASGLESFPAVHLRMPVRAVDDDDTMATSTAMLHENNLRIIAELFQRLELLEFLLVRHANTNPPVGEGKGTLSLVLYPHSDGLPLPFTLTRDISGCPRLCRVCRCRQPS